tara:strand:- start:46 stop:1242 length:1197 start_codon:yes stop_codon:yes gene_type:complete
MNRDYQEGLRSNIWKFFLFEIFWTMMFWLPIFQIYYLGRGLNITQIAFIAVTWAIARMVLEIPTGMLADKWGRKKTLFLSQVFFMIAMVILVLAHNFWVFILATIFSTLWYTCYSGTATAFFYDTLKELKREKEYEKLNGKLYLITAVVGFFAALSSGFLFNIYDALPYILTIIPIVITLPIILSFTEPKFHKHAEENTLYLHFKSSVNKIIKSEHLIFIVIFGAILTFALDYLYDYGQIYLKVIGVPIVFFGVIFAFQSIIEGIGGGFAHKIKDKFSYRGIFTFSLLFTTAIVFGLSYLNNYFGIILFLMVFFVMGLFRIVERGYIHKRVESHNRATVDSTGTFALSAFAIIFEPIAGKIADLYSIRTAFFVLGCVMLAYGIYYFIFKFKKKRLFEG